MPATSGIQAAVLARDRGRDPPDHRASRDRWKLSGRMLGRVDDEALTDQGVHGAVGDSRDGWLAHDVPYQDLVEPAGQRMVVVAHANRALEPPVRRMQRVCAMVPGHCQSRPGQLGDELAAGEDPDVAALVVVIVL